MSKFSSNTNNSIGFFKVLLATTISLIVSLVLILVFALLIKWFEWSDSVIAPVNVVIKIVSISIGVLLVTKEGRNGIIRGSIIGVSYIILSYIIFSLLLGSFSFGVSNILDLVLGLIAGAIIGIIAVNLKK